MDVKKQPLAGSSLTNWIRLLWENHFAIDLKYLPRALYVIFIIIITIPFRIFEKIRFDKIVNKTTVKDPIFIIGHWRSGTTYLHNIMSKDKNLAHVSTFQTMAPGIFLGWKNLFEPIVEKSLPETRPMDNVKMAPEFPYEEEYAIANLSPYSFHHGWYFPKNMACYYKKFVLFDNVSEEVIGEWKKTYLYFLKKVTLQSGKRLLLKGLVNTARVKLLLEIFPNAKFIHIYRNPYEVYFSTMKLYKNILPIFAFHDISEKEIEKNVLDFYEKMYQKFFDEKDLIPDGNLVEIRYEDFIQDPLEELKRIYSELDIPSFEKSKEDFKKYIASQSEYEKSKYKLDDETREKIYSKWKFTIDKWEYGRDLSLHRAKK